MHEAGLMSEALNQAIAAAGEAGASRIECLTFKYAPTAHVTPEIIETLFQAMSRGTIAEGAHLVVRPQVVTLHCVHCDRDYLVGDATSVCPICQRTGLPVGDARELVLESIEIHE